MGALNSSASERDLMMHRESESVLCVRLCCRGPFANLCLFCCSTPRKSTHLSNLHQNFSLFAECNFLSSPPGPIFRFKKCIQLA